MRWRFCWELLVYNFYSWKQKRQLVLWICQRKVCWFLIVVFQSQIVLIDVIDHLVRFGYLHFSYIRWNDSVRFFLWVFIVFVRRANCFLIHQLVNLSIVHLKIFQWFSVGENKYYVDKCVSLALLFIVYRWDILVMFKNILKYNYLIL